MIKFKPLKWKHKRRAEELSKLINTNEANEEDILFFVLGLVESWDFKDAETGELLSVTTATNPATGRDYYPCMDEMTLEQYVELMSMFNRRMGVEESGGVKKTNAAPSYSGSTPSKVAESPRRRPRNGLK